MCFFFRNFASQSVFTPTRMTTKELKIAYNVLTEIDYDVPADLLVLLADSIRVNEEKAHVRRISRMTEEDLIRLQNKPQRTLRINTPDGLLFHKRTNEETFRAAIRSLSAKQVHELGLRLRTKEWVVKDSTGKRQRLKGYVPLEAGYFLLAKSTIKEKQRMLAIVDNALQLDWDIQLR